ncbi:MAG: hypothetical protein ABFC24_06240 [Methanoregulaceae archaeon]
MKQADAPEDAWKQVPVLIRMDIYTRATEKGVNISDACNQALAQVLQIRYKKPEPADVPSPHAMRTREPEKKAEKKGIPARPKGPLMPVMDAEEYLRTGKIEIPKRQPAALPKEPPEEQVSGPGTPHLPPSHPLPKKAKRGHSGEYSTVKKFYQSRIELVPEDSGTDARITKDHMYQEFLKWSVANSLEPIPDRKQFADLLKKRFSISDLVVKGHHYWANVHLK